MRPNSLRVFSSGLFVFGLWTAWSQGQRRIPDTTSKITDHLYVIQGNGGNVALFTSGEGAILVDDMYAQDGPEIAANVKSVTNEPLKYIISTHQHADHTGSNDMFRSQDVQILMHRNARSNLAMQKQPGLSQITFADDAELFLGGHSVQMRHLGRGHTNGDAVVYFPSERVIHTGDLFVTDGEIYIDMANGGTIKEWDQTVSKVLQYDFDVVIPGHGGIAKRADLVHWIQTLQKLRERIGDACRPGAVGSGSRLDLTGLGLKPIWLKDTIPSVCKDLQQ
jgi:glyoxylase-like metal-dependent hydrolase (beta-lactamase superfamily II)